MVLKNSSSLYKTDIKYQYAKCRNMLKILTNGTREQLLEDMMVKGKELGEDIFQIVQDNNIDVIIAQNTNNMLTKKLNELLDSYQDEIRASRRRLQKSKKNYAV